MTLIYIPKPFKDESAASLIIRTTGKNGYRTPSSLLRAYGINIYGTSLNSFFFDRDKFKTIIQNLSLNESYKVLAPSNYGPTSKVKKFYNDMIIYENFLSQDGSRLCCACIKEHNYLRVDWMIKYLSICPKHQFSLLENCPQCQTPINPNRNFINICSNCDYDFSNNIQEKSSLLEINANLWLFNIIYKRNLDQLKIIKAFFDIINYTKKTFKKIKFSKPIVILGYLYFENYNEYKTEFIKFINENSTLAHPRILSIHFISSYQDVSVTHENILADYPINTKLTKYENHNFLLSQRSAYIALNTTKHNLKQNYFPKLDSTSKISSKLIENYIIGKKKSLKFNELPNIYCDARTLAEILSINYQTSCILLKKSKIFDSKKIPYNRNKITVTRLKDVQIFNKKYITVHALAASISIPTINLYSKLLSLGISPKFGPSIDGTPVNIYLRKDVQHITATLIYSTVYKKPYINLDNFKKKNE